MLLIFIVLSVLIGMFMSYIWSSNGIGNTLAKMVFSLYTLFAIVMLLIQLHPLLIV